MIQLTCIKCQTVLSIDDAFAGGVCRCQHCGTIQKVPARRARPSAPGDAPAAAPPQPPKPPGRPGADELPPQPTLRAAPPPPPPPPPPAPAAPEAAPEVAAEPGADPHLTRADLQHLAQAVATSSGLGTHQQRSTEPPGAPPAPVMDYQTPTPARQSRTWMIAAIAAGVALLLVLAGVLLWRSAREQAVRNSQGATVVPAPAPGAPNSPGNTTPQDPALAMTTPNFLGVPVQGPVVIYIIDRGQGTVETFDGLRGAVMKSLGTLGPDIRFQVLFWDTSDELAYPAGGPVSATPANIKSAGKVVADAIAFGASSVEKPLEKALDAKPSVILIATGKFGLDDAWVAGVKKIVQGKGVKVDTFALGRSDCAAQLKSIAEATGGTFRVVNMGTMIQLADFAPSGN